MSKLSIKDVIAILVIGLGTVLALAFTDFGLSGAAIVGALAIVVDTWRAVRRNKAVAS